MSIAERVIAGYMTPSEFPHGTPDGFEQGCRNVCPAESTGQSCRQASIRYRGDFAYRRLVNDGAPVDVLRLPEVFVKPAKPKKAMAPKVPKVVAEAQPKAERAPRVAAGRGRPVGATEWRHGTQYGYNVKKCHKGSDCPGGEDGRTCFQAKAEASTREYQERNERRRAARVAAGATPRPRIRGTVVRSEGGQFTGRVVERVEHGTTLMYKRGCHTGDPCPAGEFGPTCAEVMAAYNREYQRKNGVRIRATRKTKESTS